MSDWTGTGRTIVGVPIGGARISVSDIRGAIGTPLSDDSLSLIIDSENDEITRRYGADTTQTETVRGNNLYITLSSTPTSVTSVTEVTGGESIALSPSDYIDWSNGILERSGSGVNPKNRWGDRVTVTYSVTYEANRRKLVLLNLCKLAIQYNGLKSESTGGEYSTTSQDYFMERERLLRTLAPRGGGAWFA